MDPLIPLVVSQVNPDDLEGHPGIIANPNCSTMQLVPVLMALRDAVGLERVVVDTYQAVSGTGGGAIRELEGQVRAHVAGEPKDVAVYPHQIAFNALPQVDVFLENGYTKEEWKLVNESRKILHLPDLRVSCTAVRVPVFVAHSEAVHVETRAPITPDRARELFAAVAGVVVQDDPSSSTYPLATEAAGSDEIFVGRVRQDESIDGGRGLAFWVVSDNLRKGAATNAVQIAEVLVERGWVRSATARGVTPYGTVAARGPRRRRGGPERPDRGRGVTSEERKAALEAIAAEVRACTRCRLHETRTLAVPGEGNPDTEVVFVGEGPGFNEDRQGRPFVGRAGDLLVKLLGSLGGSARTSSSRTSSSAARPTTATRSPTRSPPAPPYLQRQLEVLDPALVVTLGRHSMARFLPGARISQVHGTTHPVDPATGARDATVLAMYHPAAALRTPAIERESYDDIGHAPRALLDARTRREHGDRRRSAADDRPGRTRPRDVDVATLVAAAADPGAAAPDELTIF